MNKELEEFARPYAEIASKIKTSYEMLQEAFDEVLALMSKNMGASEEVAASISEAIKRGFNESK